ncbi:hypothetical protein DBT_0497 [Dissulfuribacter thermophilus]|uniref:Chemotaxis protein CheX n=1 Tax=Dissulfuribacter thermophilus TaxID=1156395 RepID=A0A1B9F8A1_9BACT|nr:DUF3334 family protein [Dissulfuribacter thermophilus]OCC16035.1 hypothetical protein DBT_0497 [Dissulfuribacter thermophilus]
MPKVKTINRVAQICCNAVKHVLEQNTGSKIRYSPTIQNVPNISLKPDLGCFVQFSGDYSGLFIMNFSAEAALELYQKAMSFMGLPQEEMAQDYDADEVVNFIGEMVNQIIGTARRMVEEEYGLSASNNQPKAITISSAITMSIATMLDRPVCRRLSFKTENNSAFYVEMNMEQTEFIRLEDFEAQNNHLKERNSSNQGGSDLDIDALIEQYS